VSIWLFKCVHFPLLLSPIVMSEKKSRDFYAELELHVLMSVFRWSRQIASDDVGFRSVSLDNSDHLSYFHLALQMSLLRQVSSVGCQFILFSVVWW